MAKALTAAELAARIGGSLAGSPDVNVTGVGGLSEATAADVSFLGNPKYADKVLPSAAGVVLVPEDFEPPPPTGRAWIRCANPSAAFAQVVAVFAPAPVTYPPGVSPAATVDPSAELGADVHVGPGAVISAAVRIGRNTVIGAGTFIGQETTVGDHCLIYPNVTVRERCSLGSRVIVHCGTVIGSDGFGYLPGPGGHTKIPQVGTVQIDDDVELGALVAVDRARFGKTWIKTGVKVDNLVQIAHNVVIGEHAIIISQVGISGSSRVGTGSVLAGQAGVAGHLDIGPGVTVAAKAGVTKDIPAGVTVIGQPAVERRQFLKQQVQLKRLERFQQKVTELEETVETLRQKLDRNDAP